MPPEENSMPPGGTGMPQTVTRLLRTEGGKLVVKSEMGKDRKQTKSLIVAEKAQPNQKKKTKSRQNRKTFAVGGGKHGDIRTFFKVQAESRMKRKRDEQEDEQMKENSSLVENTLPHDKKLRKLESVENIEQRRPLEHLCLKQCHQRELESTL